MKYLATALIAFGLLTACSSEDDLTPSNADINGFAPAEDDNSLTAQIRNNFYEATGAYLLFTDTLTSQGSNGKPELLDISYSLVGSSSVYSEDYKYSYITDPTEQQKAADLVKNYLVPRLGKAVPNAFFLVNDISYPYGSRTRHTSYLLGTRAYALSMDDGAAYEQPDSFAIQLLKDIILDRIDRLGDDEKAEFLAFSEDYYYNDLEVDSLTDQEIWDLGMFYYVEDEYFGSYYYGESTDWKLWVEAVLEYTPEAFEQKYGSSAVMLSKFNIIRNLILDMGFTI
ncbi:MAG: hypothetical protein ACOYJF_07140 [Prevotella sp.]